MSERVVLVLTLEQAQAVAEGAELLARLGFGQLEAVEHLVSVGHIPVRTNQEQRSTAGQDEIDAVRDLMMGAKKVLGFSASSSYGPAHPHSSSVAKRSWEAYKALSQALARHRDPRPVHPGSEYDGLRLRCTDEPEPAVRMVSAAEAMELLLGNDAAADQGGKS